MGKPKARPGIKEAGKGKSAATRPVSKSGAYPFSVARARLPAQCRGGPMPLQVRKLQGGPGPQEREARTERVVDAAVAAGVEGAAPMLASARAATEGEPASAPAAAAGAGLTMPSASWLAGPHLAEEGGHAVEEAEAVGEQVHTEEAEVAASPSPVPAFVIAEVVTAAARQGTGEPSARDSAGVVVSARRTFGDKVGDRQARSQTVRSRAGPASAAPRKSGKKFRAQQAPRRLGSGLGPAAPGPLLGWLRQGQP
ncbi:unnamed protein product [Closterium sp. NIES-65]|nr:unnamed protein product [Closterium sp. NIES-65]